MPIEISMYLSDYYLMHLLPGWAIPEIMYTGRSDNTRYWPIDTVGRYLLHGSPLYMLATAYVMKTTYHERDMIDYMGQVNIWPNGISININRHGGEYSPDDKKEVIDIYRRDTPSDKAAALLRMLGGLDIDMPLTADILSDMLLEEGCPEGSFHIVDDGLFHLRVVYGRGSVELWKSRLIQSEIAQAAHNVKFNV